jgi:ribonucleotide monophosphatase NagD (HAD superfamily)
VTYLGKPYPEIYRQCLARLADPPPDRVLCIGDSLHHDIRGANRVGMGSVLVTSGVHAQELMASGTADQTAAAIRSLADPEELPRWFMPALAW